jgi:hypothetical protein
MLSDEQLATATDAEVAMPSEFTRATQRQDSEPASLGEGPSRLMEKSRHPLDFGGIDFEPGEDDPEVQLAILKAYKDVAERKFAEAKKRVRANRDRDERASRDPVLPKTSNEQMLTAPRQSTEAEPSDQIPHPIGTPVDRNDQPVEQERAPQGRNTGVMPSEVLHPKSTIARSLLSGGRAAHLGMGNGGDDGDDDSSDSSSDSSSDTTDSADSELSDLDVAYGNRRNKKRKKRTKRKIMVRPKEPTEYSGEVDFRKFNRFLKEGRMYLKDARFPKKEYIMRIAPFLKGKALNFYTQKGEMYESQWDLKMFFNQLFDYCFPPNYRMNLRDRLENTVQSGDHSVTQYAHNIQELFNMLGNVASEDQVIKLWKGLRPEIQEGLWRDKLNPDHSTWDEVLEQAIRIEMAIKAVKSIGQRKQGSYPANSSNNKNSSGGGNRSQSSRPFKGNNFRKFGNGTSGNSDNRGEGISNGQRGSSSTPAPAKGFKQGTPAAERSQYKLASHNGKPNRGDRVFKQHGKPGGQNGQKPDHSDLLCYSCGEPGHISRNCPRGNVVSHHGKKPPGAASFSVEIAGIEPVIEEGTDEVEVLDSLPLGAVLLMETDSHENEGVEPLWYESILGRNTVARPELGDCYAMFIEWILSTWGNYPEDVRFGMLRENPQACKMPVRFNARRVRRDNYLIVDHRCDFRIKIPIALMENPLFDLRSWYAKRRAKHFNVKKPKMPYRSFGYPLQEIPEMLLLDGVISHYPSTDLTETVDADRFAVERVSLESREDYLIKDRLLDLEIPISRDMLMDQTFNLVGWYRDFLDDTGIYAKFYEDDTLEFEAGLQYHRTACQWVEQKAEGTQDLNDEDPGAESDDSLPGLQSLTDSESDDESEDETEVDSDLSSFYDTESYRGDSSPMLPYTMNRLESQNQYQMGPVYEERIVAILNDCTPFPGDRDDEVWLNKPAGSPGSPIRFEVEFAENGLIEIFDRRRGFCAFIHRNRLRYHGFSVGRWYAEFCAREMGQYYSDAVVQAVKWYDQSNHKDHRIETPLEDAAAYQLLRGVPYGLEADGYLDNPLDRFTVTCRYDNIGVFEVYDRLRHLYTELPRYLLEDPEFEIRIWYRGFIEARYKSRIDLQRGAVNPSKIDPATMTEIGSDPTVWKRVKSIVGKLLRRDKDVEHEAAYHLFGTQVDRNKFPHLERNAATRKGPGRRVPKPIVVTVTLNGQPCRALLDSGSLGDFISSKTAVQLNLKLQKLEKPIAVQLAVSGSRTKVNSYTETRLQYQGIDEIRSFDIINVSSYDLILGTPWMWQHQVCLGFNRARVVIGSDNPIPLTEGADSKPLISALQSDDEQIEHAREELQRAAAPLCRTVAETELPPLRVINHKIPLIDENKTYPWRPSRCPEAFRPQWAEKRDAYVRSGRWIMTSTGSTIPMMFIPKPNKGDGPPKLRTVFDLRERNKNTRKMTSPLPDIDGVLRRVAAHPCRSILDLQASFEQIRVEPDHVSRNAATTPDGNILSTVVMQGDCNAPATQQTLMVHLFGPYLGRFLDVYLDDIIIYSDTLVQHIEHVKLVFSILEREKMYLSKDKLQFIPAELRVLGHVVGDSGIRMDSDKVDSVLNWKCPTNRDLLRGFLGSVGYLADNVPGVRIPMGILSAITGDAVPFRWTFTEQRAFEDVRHLVHQARDFNRTPLSYAEGAPPIWMITDGCATGVSGVIAQGDDWKAAKVAAFYSAKLNPAQQNYATHEIELLAGIETMLRHQDQLQGTRFKWVTDHKGLTHFLNQKNLSGRQARWLEKISSFDFEVVYVPGSENVVADALSRIYSNDAPGTVRARSEYTYHDVINEDLEILTDPLPILAGVEAVVETIRRKKRDTPPAETGRPETGREFAARMKDHFVLRGPGERKEGGLPNMPTNALPSESAIDTSNRQLPSEADTSNRQLPSEAAPPNADLLLERLALTDLVDSSADGLDLLKEIRGRVSEDAFFKTVLEKPEDYRNFRVKDGLLYLQEKEKPLLCIPKILVQGRSAREIVIAEGHSLLAHLGPSKTLGYLRDHVWWPNMVPDVKAFCDTCVTCRRSKPSNQKPYGLLNPLPIPGHPWEAIGVDFVGPLPKSSNRDGTFDSIAVVICLLTSMVHLIPSKTTYKAREMAELMFEEVYKLHGIPRRIISDRDTLFTSDFWTHLHQLLGTKLKMSSAYHPETDGATERANRTVTQMLRQCVNDKQTDWVSKLPAIEFAVNSARSESTGYAPFFLNTGRMPRSMLIDPPATSKEFPSVRNFAIQKRLALMAAHDSIIAARVKQTRDANRKRRVEPFETGDLVYVSTKNITFPKGLARKLIPKFIGPYKILQDFRNHSFRIELPTPMKARGIRDSFHASLLRAHIPNDDRLFPGRQDDQLSWDETHAGEWAIERILSHAGSGENSVFEIKWTTGDTTWLSYDLISDLQGLTTYLDLLGINDISKLPKGDGKPPIDDPQVYLGTIPITNPDPSSRKKGCKITHYLSSFISLFLSCLCPRSANIDHFDYPTILTDSKMAIDLDTESGPSPVSDLARPVHPLIEGTTEGDFVVKTKPGDKGAKFPRGLTFTRNMIVDYITYSDRCCDAIVMATSDEIQKLRKRSPAGYPEFASYYNQTADLIGQFATFDKTVDNFLLALPQVTLDDFGIVIPTPGSITVASSSSISEAGSSTTAKRSPDRKPYAREKQKKTASLTSLLQDTHKLRGVDALLADLLITSASQHASRAKMGTLHFGIRNSKRKSRKAKDSGRAKHIRADPTANVVDSSPMEGVEAGPSSALLA